MCLLNGIKKAENPHFEKFEYNLLFYVYEKAA